MSGHLDGPPPGPPDPPYIEGDLGAPSREEFAHKRRSERPMSTTPLSKSPDAVTAAAYAMCEMRGDIWNGRLTDRRMWTDLARAALEAAERTRP